MQKINKDGKNVKRLEKMIRKLDTEKGHDDPFSIICDYCKHIAKCPYHCIFKLKYEV